MSKQKQIFEDDPPQQDCYVDHYVPRHVRMGICTKPMERPAPIHELADDSVSITESGRATAVAVVLRSVPASETLGKYRVEDFQLGNLLDAGVPLKLVSLEQSESRSIQDIQRIAQKLDDLDVYAQNLAKSKADFESMFSSSNSQNLES